jgi:cob(I)alamin adenosyltransferase
MNGNELANLLEVDSWYKLVTREEIATMLRQQQAEIQALKEKLMMEEESYMLLDEELLFAKESIKHQQTEIKALKEKLKSEFEYAEKLLKVKQ